MKTTHRIIWSNWIWLIGSNRIHPRCRISFTHHFLTNFSYAYHCLCNIFFPNRRFYGKMIWSRGIYLWLIKFFLQDRIMVSLTSLLVLASLLSQTSGTLPKTSYFKMVDIWLFSCIVTIFLIILFHTATAYFSREEINFFNKEIPSKILHWGKLVLPILLTIFNSIYWWFAYAFS